jgi:hypothetical protein
MPRITIEANGIFFHCNPSQLAVVTAQARATQNTQGSDILTRASQAAKEGLEEFAPIGLTGAASRNFSTALRSTQVRRVLLGHSMPGDPDTSVSKALSWVAAAADAQRHLTGSSIEVVLALLKEIMSHRPHDLPVPSPPPTSDFIGICSAGTSSRGDESEDLLVSYVPHGPCLLTALAKVAFSAWRSHAHMLTGVRRAIDKQQSIINTLTFRAWRAACGKGTLVIDPPLAASSHINQCPHIFDIFDQVEECRPRNALFTTRLGVLFCSISKAHLARAFFTAWRKLLCGASVVALAFVNKWEMRTRDACLKAAWLIWRKFSIDNWQHASAFTCVEQEMQTDFSGVDILPFTYDSVGTQTDIQFDNVDANIFTANSPRAQCFTAWAVCGTKDSTTIVETAQRGPCLAALSSYKRYIGHIIHGFAAWHRVTIGSRIAPIFSAAPLRRAKKSRVQQVASTPDTVRQDCDLQGSPHLTYMLALMKDTLLECFPHHRACENAPSTFGEFCSFIQWSDTTPLRYPIVAASLNTEDAALLWATGWLFAHKAATQARQLHYCFLAALRDQDACEFSKLHDFPCLPCFVWCTTIVTLDYNVRCGVHSS